MLKLFYRKNKEEPVMMYPFMTLNDGTEIVHSEMRPDGQVKVYMETPDERVCFKHATCYLPSYTWENIYEYSQEEISRLQEIIQSTAHLILEFAQEGGFANASNLKRRNKNEMERIFWRNTLFLLMPGAAL